MDAWIAQALRHGNEGERPVVRMPQMPRAEYERADATLRAAGGVWDRHAGGHRFPEGTDTREAVAEAFAKGWNRDANPLDFFPTPDDLADELVSMAVEADWADRLEYLPDARLSALEPRAGHGAIVKALWRVVPQDRLDLTAFELDSRNHRWLGAMGVAATEADFLSAPVGERVDVAVMNPPFSGQGAKAAWARHATRALAWLKPGGTLATLLPACDVARAGPEAIDLWALANATGGVEDHGVRRFQPADRRTKGTDVAVRSLTAQALEADDWRDRPCNGHASNWMWQTALIIRNNDWRLLDDALRGLPERGPERRRELERRLGRQRPAWVAHGAAWVAGKVTAAMVAEAALSWTEEWSGGEPEADPPPTEAAAGRERQAEMAF